MPRYELSIDEIRVLQECSSESFYRRCVPFMTLLGGTTYAAVYLGYLSPNPKWGAIPKVTLAVAFGFLAGKISYTRACENKLMVLKNSELGDMIRKQRESEETIYYVNGKSYHLSKKELETIEECNFDSFWYRSFPLATALNCLVGVGVQTGYLKPNPRFGILPKLILASFIGHIAGQISYTQTCVEKFKRIPDSELGEMLRKLPKS